MTMIDNREGQLNLPTVTSREDLEGDKGVFFHFSVDFYSPQAIVVRTVAHVDGEDEIEATQRINLEDWDGEKLPDRSKALREVGGSPEVVRAQRRHLGGYLQELRAAGLI